MDRSRLAEGILPYARLFARLLDLPVEFLHVNAPSQNSSYSPPPIKRNEYLEKMAASFPLAVYRYRTMAHRQRVRVVRYSTKPVLIIPLTTMTGQESQQRG